MSIDLPVTIERVAEFTSNIPGYRPPLSGTDAYNKRPLARGERFTNVADKFGLIGVGEGLPPIEVPLELNKLTPLWAPGIVRTIGEKFNADLPAITDLGASPDASASYNTGAFIAARGAGLDTGKGYRVHVPRGTYQVNDTITLTLPGTKFYGAGKGNTILVNTTPDKPTFFISSFAQSCGVHDMTLDRAVTATGSKTTGLGGNGIESGSNTNRAEIHRVISTNNWNGALLRAAAWGDLLDYTGEGNVNHGLAFTNGSGGGVQWNTTGTCLLQHNGGDGLRVFSYDDGTVNNPIIILGEWFGITTFGNAGHGISFFGSAAIPIHDIRLHIPLCGTDKGNEVYVDSYGNDHTITGGFYELSGQDGITGIPLTDCIVITANNPKGIRITGAKIPSPGKRGIVSFAPRTIIVGCDVHDPGQNPAANSIEKAGVHLLGADSSFVGGEVLNGSFGAIMDGANGLIAEIITTGQSVAKFSYNDTTTVVGCPGAPMQMPGLLKGTPFGILDALTPTRLAAATIAQITTGGAYFGVGSYAGSSFRITDRGNRPAYMGADGVWKWVSGDVAVTTSN